jgi:hypothetical protein
MATLLSKTVNRELNRVKATKRGRIELPDKSGFITADARAVVVSLLPSDIIQFRVKGTRKPYSAPLSTVMMFAQAMLFYDEYTEAMRVYNLQKSAGYKRKRKPKKPNHPHIASMLRRLHGVVAGG